MVTLFCNRISACTCLSWSRISTWHYICCTGNWLCFFMQLKYSLFHSKNIPRDLWLAESLHNALNTSKSPFKHLFDACLYLDIAQVHNLTSTLLGPFTNLPNNFTWFVLDKEKEAIIAPLNLIHFLSFSDTFSFLILTYFLVECWFLHVHSVHELNTLDLTVLPPSIKVVPFFR